MRCTHTKPRSPEERGDSGVGNQNHKAQKGADNKYSLKIPAITLSNTLSYSDLA